VDVDGTSLKQTRHVRSPTASVICASRVSVALALLSHSDVFEARCSRVGTFFQACPVLASTT
jgi:hypothetical protein